MTGITGEGAVSTEPVTPLEESSLATLSDIEREAEEQVAATWEAMSDDFHTPRAIAALFELGRITAREEWRTVSDRSRVRAAQCYRDFAREVLGLAPTERDTDGSGGATGAAAELTEGLVSTLLTLRAEARAAKDFARADAIRDRLTELGIQIEDSRDGTSSWSVSR